MDTKIDSYIMLFDLFLDFDYYNDGIRSSDVQDEALEFVNSLKLSEHLNHYAFHRDLSGIEGMSFRLLDVKAQEDPTHLSGARRILDSELG